MNATVTARRETALRMKRDGASLRDIARHLGVSKDTVRRDLAAIERDTMRQPDQRNATDQTPSETPCDTSRATGGTPCDTTPETHETPPASSNPQLSIEVDAKLRRDLDTMTGTGMTDWQAIATAVHFIAGIYRTSWAHGAVPDGIAPRIVTASVLPPKKPT
jgi:IS30 family transposase